MTFPVLYIEETLDDSKKDWHFCITYNYNDTYVVYGYRYNYKNDFYTKMMFLSRSAVVTFLRNACCTESSTMDITMYFSDDSVEDNFEGVYGAYRYNNELFGYDNHSFTEESLMDFLKILRDLRM